MNNNNKWDSKIPKVIEKWNNNRTFEKITNNGNIFIEIAGINLDFKLHHLEYGRIIDLSEIETEIQRK